MALRADDGTILEIKEPVILGPEIQNDVQNEFQNDDPSTASIFQKAAPRVKTVDLGKWGFWLAPLAILAVVAFLVFGTLFIAVLIGVTLLVALLRRVVNLFRL